MNSTENPATFARKEAIRRRWRKQGFIVFPDGTQHRLKSVSKGVTIAGVLRYDAAVDLVNEESWSVIFTETDELTVTGEQQIYLEQERYSNVLLVSLVNPTIKRIALELPNCPTGYEDLFSPDED